jgi:DNA-binding response OmpR family regulator
MSAFEQQPGGSSTLIALLSEVVTPPQLALIDDICTIGRGQACTLVVNNPLVSRLHAKIERSGPHYILADAGSANGTYLNGRRIIEPRQLRSDDQIGLGTPAALLRFTDPEATVLTEGVLRYDERIRAFFLDSTVLDLSSSQFQLLLHLYLHAGELCSRASCAQALWGRDFNPELDQGALNTAVSELRGVMSRAKPGTEKLIVARRGFGYELQL